MASNRYAPEGTYDPYRGDDESGTYEVYGSFNSYQHHESYAGYEGFAAQDGFAANHALAAQDGFVQYGAGQYDAHGALWTETYEFAAVTDEPVAVMQHSIDEAPAPTPAPSSEALGEWNPTKESVRSVRGRHKVVKQRGGSMARSGAVLGVGMIAAVGAGGIATAQEKPAAISMPDVSEKAKELPGVGSLLGGDETVVAGGPLTQGALTESDAAAGRDTGEALRSRILQQAADQKSQAATSAQEAALTKAADAAEAKAKQELSQNKKAAAEKARKAEAARLAKLAKSFSLPVAGAQLTSYFGEAGSLWSNDHTGQDFAAASGTPIKAVASGTIKEAGWAGSFGYRTILELKDGTELWFAHQSSMNVSAGEKVAAGDVIGRVGATGNVTGAHLHLEVHPGGGSAIDPLAWMRGKGLKV